MKEVFDYLKSFLKDDDVIVFGCSSGPDSMALFDILVKIRKELNIYLVCAHVNHNVRKQSYKEMAFMEEYCKKNNVAYESMIIEKYGDDNFHNEARTIRYNFFESLIKKYNGNYLMTAHHGDDLVETILMRIVRGSTIGGYSGFAQVVEKDNYKIVRPLIFVTKDDILHYNVSNSIPYFVDKSNFKIKYTRNRYRKYVLPFLKKEDNNVHKKFYKYSMTLEKYDNYINKQVLSIINKVYKDNTLDINKYNKLDDIIKSKIIYFILEKEYADDLVLINDVHVNLIENLISSSKSNSYIYLPNNIKVIKSYDKLTLAKETDEIDSYEIEINDYTHLPNGKVIERINASDINDNNYCRLLSTDVTLPLSVRTRKSGDKMIIKNMDGYKKVKDIFIDCKIPLKERDIWPIVVDAKDNIVWIPGLKKSKLDVLKNKKCDIILKYY